MNLDNMKSIFIDVKAMGPNITEQAESEAVHLIKEALDYYIESKRKKSWYTALI